MNLQLFLLVCFLIKINGKACTSKLQIYFCKKYNYYGLIMKFNEVNKLYCTFDTDCSYTTVTYQMVFVNEKQKLSSTSQQCSFTLPAYSIQELDSISIFGVIVEAKGENIKHTVADYCILDAVLFPPVPVILGGTMRYVTGTNPLILDGTQSMYFHVPKNEQMSSYFKWKCTEGGAGGAIGAGPPCTGINFPNDLYTKIPSELLTDKKTYNFELSLRTQPGTWYSTNQTIVVDPSATETRIGCKENCPPLCPWTARWNETVFSVTCDANCDAAGDNFSWSVKYKYFKINKWTKGRYGKVFTIIKDGFRGRRDQRAEVKVQVIDNNLQTKPGFSRIDLIVPPSSMGPCNVTPRAGIALKTEFTIEECYTTSIIIAGSYELSLADAGEKGFPLARAKDSKDIKFILPSKIFRTALRFFDEYDNKIIAVLNITIEELFPPDAPNVKELVHEHFKKILASLHREGVAATGKALQELQLFPIEIEHLVNEKLIQRYQHDLKLEYLGYQIPKDDKAEAEKNEKMCSDIYKTLYEDSKEDKEDGNEQELTNNILLEKCNFTKLELEAETRKDPDFLVPTTAYPLIEAPMIQENYPDYLSDEATKRIDDIPELFLKICRADFESIEKHAGVKSKMLISQAIHQTVIGVNISKLDLELNNVKAIPPADIFPNDTLISVKFCASKMKQFLWNNLNISTPLILLEFINFEEDERISNFKKPVQVVFAGNFTSNFIKFQQISLTSIKGKLTDEDIWIGRMYCRYYSTMSMDFSDLNGATIEMVVTDNRSPILYDFQSSHTIEPNKTTFHRTYEYKYQGWTYIGLLLRPLSNVTTEKVSINLTAYTVSCSTWNSRRGKWESDHCKVAPSTDYKRIVCECYRLSVLAGVVKSLHIKHQTPLHLKFSLVLLISYTVIISLYIIFLIYCIAITCNVTKHHERDIYMLSDISVNDLYAYLVIVKTSYHLSAGTTSNICIQLCGEKADSKPHVLNYPDPKHKLLRRLSEDWFVLTTRTHLGRVHSIKLWTDSVGRHPSWNCQDVFIYDLQTKLFWVFHVEKWLCVIRGTVFMEVSSEETLKKSVIKKVIRKFYETKYKFTSFKNLTIHLSVIVTLFSANMIGYGLPELRLRDGFAYVDYYSLHPHVIYIGFGSSVITFCTHMGLIWLFRHADEQIRDKTEEKRRFSYKVTIACWVLLMVNITVHMNLLIIFGFWLPEITSILWLTSCAISLALYYIVFNNVYLLIENIYIKTKLQYDNIGNKFKKIVNTIGKQRKIIYRKFGYNGLRQYITHLYNPLSDKDVKAKKEKLLLRHEIWEILQDIIMFSIYASLLFSVLLINRSRSTVVAHREMSELLQGLHTHTEDFSKIDSIKAFREYVEETLIAVVNSPHERYAGFVMENPGLLFDYHHRILGIARLRQHRTKEICDVPKQMNFLAKCRAPEFFELGEFENHTSPKRKDSGRLAQIWKYQLVREAGRLTNMGIFGFYPGGGFIAPLGRTKYNSLANFDYLEHKAWFDNLTRVVFIEFATYNCHENLFNFVDLFVEFSATGYTVATIKVQSASLVFVHQQRTIILTTIVIAFLVIVALLIVRVTFRVYEKRKIFFKLYWNYVDLVIISITVGCTYLYYSRSKAIEDFLKKIEKAKHNEFIIYFHLMFADILMNSMAALLIFISTIRLWKLLRFALVFRILERSVLVTLRLMYAWIIYQIILAFAFSLIGYVIFGSTSKDFRTLYNSAITIILLSLDLYDSFDFDTLWHNNRVYGLLFYFVMEMFSFLVYHVSICIIIYAYIESSVYYSTIERPYDLRDYLKELFLYYKKTIRFRLKGGEVKTTKDIPKKVIPKAAEHRYANCLDTTAQRMRTMGLIVRIFLAKKLKLNTDKRIGQLFIHLLSKEVGGKEYFFKKVINKDSIKLIPDVKLMKMERCTEVILNEEAYREVRLEREKREEQYKKQFQTNMNDRLDRCQQQLDSLLQAFKNIEYVE